MLRKSRLSAIEWKAPAEPDLESLLPVEFGLPFGIATEPTLGFPKVPDQAAATALSEAVFFSQAGAEIEHALLVQYLYAAYSLDLNHPRAQDWQTDILNIAREEMGHLVTVQNVLALLGQPPYLGRPDHPINTDFFPFQLELGPASLHSIAQYVIAESPFFDNLPEELQPVAQSAAGTVHHVGVLYGRLYYLVQPDDQYHPPFKVPLELQREPKHHIAAADLQPQIASGDTAGVITGKEEWPGGGDQVYVDRTPNVQATLDAINRIAVQGEGLDSDLHSHYARFYNIYVQMQAATKAGETFVLPVVKNPNTGSGPEEGRITNPVALAWAKLFNLRYHALLLDILQALHHPASEVVAGTPLRQKLADNWAIQGEMTTHLKQIALTLTTLPARSGSPAGPFAGAPFEMPEQEFPETEAERWQWQKHIIQESAEWIAKIGADDNFGTLALITDFDSGRLADIESWMAAH